MIISNKMQKAINDQINAELWSAYMYLSMSAFFEAKGLKGFARWMRVQFAEEQSHAMKFFDYIYSRGGKVELQPISPVPTEWKDPLDVFTETLEHEQKVTTLIHALMTLAIEEKDYATQSFLQWFIDEQVEEEDVAAQIIDKLKMINNNPQGIYMLDRELGARSGE